MNVNAHAHVLHAAAARAGYAHAQGYSDRKSVV